MFCSERPAEQRACVLLCQSADHPRARGHPFHMRMRAAAPGRVRGLSQVGCGERRGQDSTLELVHWHAGSSFGPTTLLLRAESRGDDPRRLPHAGAPGRGWGAGRQKGHGSWHGPQLWALHMPLRKSSVPPGSCWTGRAVEPLPLLATSLVLSLTGSGTPPSLRLLISPGTLLQPPRWCGHEASKQRLAQGAWEPLTVIVLGPNVVPRPHFPSARWCLRLGPRKGQGKAGEVHIKAEFSAWGVIEGWSSTVTNASRSPWIPSRKRGQGVWQLSLWISSATCLSLQSYSKKNFSITALGPISCRPMICKTRKQQVLTNEFLTDCSTLNAPFPVLSRGFAMINALNKKEEIE